MSKIQKYETISFRLEKFLDFGLNYGKRKGKNNNFGHIYRTLNCEQG